MGPGVGKEREFPGIETRKGGTCPDEARDVYLARLFFSRSPELRLLTRAHKKGVGRELREKGKFCGKGRSPSARL